MITDSFDPHTAPVIAPDLSGERIPVDACIVSFSGHGLADTLADHDAEEVGALRFCCGNLPLIVICHDGRRFAFFQSYIGAPAAVGGLCGALGIIDTDTLVVYGSCGALSASIPRNTLIVPTAAYRDEGTSYHYAAPADYIEMTGADAVADFLNRSNVPFRRGRTWTTDAFFRETRGNLIKRRAEGCVCVDMECSALQAACDWYGIRLFYLLYGADLLDDTQWDPRKQTAEDSAAHKASLFELALELAADVTEGRAETDGSVEL